jgi:hypothetical protein
VQFAQFVQVVHFMQVVQFVQVAQFVRFVQVVQFFLSLVHCLLFAIATFHKRNDKCVIKHNCQSINQSHEQNYTAMQNMQFTNLKHFDARLRLSLRVLTFAVCAAY